MAELAIPIALLGGMYLISNDENKKENFIANREKIASRKRMTQEAKQNLIQNNYPTQKQGKAQLKKDPNYYPDPNNAMDKYFEQAEYEEQSTLDKNAYMSLTGDKVSKSDLNHNNMVPFFGSNIKASRDRNVNESRLDNMNGSGSQHFSKKSTAPLFKPEKNMQWAHGTPNQSSFIQSRMNPSMSLKNVKPFQEIRVGPGLNKQDGVTGSGGFNSGMESRERWMPKTVDELRVKTNPKASYKGQILGGKNPVTNRGIIGKVEKYQPETYYINGPERYMTTTGLEKKQTSRALEILPEENRASTSRSYYGSGDNAGVEASYVPSSYMPSKRAVLDPNVKHISNPSAVNRGSASTGDYGIQGYKSSVLPNNRDITTNRQPEYGAVSTFAKAVISPLMDVLRPSRKEEVIDNIRSTGNVGNSEHHAAYVYNPNDKARTTIREMTEERKNHNFVNNQSELGGGYGYLVNKKNPVSQERDTTNRNYSGNAGNSYGISEVMTYDAAYNANLIDKAPISQGRAPKGSSVKVFDGINNTNIHIDKMDCDRVNNRMFVPQQITKAPPAHQQYGKSSVRSEIGQNINMQRNSPEILDAFKKNPFAKPLDSVA
mgnify:CR=1 FL=1